MRIVNPKAVALLDACVLYPPSLRDLLMRVAIVGIYEPRWTEEIHSEWTRNVLADNPNVTTAQLERTRRLMNQTFLEGLVSGYEQHISMLSLPDANDRHVLAAAIEAQATAIVTFNLSDFPVSALRPYGIQPVHPDLFMTALFEDDPGLFLQAARLHRASLRQPPKDAAGYVATLRANRLTELALRVEANSASL